MTIKLTHFTPTITPTAVDVRNLLTMNYTLFAFCSNIFGFVVGGISLLGLIVTMLKPHLPSNKIRTLETLLEQTESTYKAALEEGLLVHEFAQVADRRLTKLKKSTQGLQARAHTAITLKQDFLEFFSGTSTAIGTTCGLLRKLRAEVITSSEARRLGLVEMSSVSFILSSPATPPTLNLEIESIPDFSVTAAISPPRSCSPAFTTGELTDPATRATEGSLFGDFTQIDSDVRTTDA